MKKAFIYNFGILLVLFFISCSENKLGKNVTTISLHPDQENEILLSEIIESISVTPLETSDQSLLSDIEKIDFDDGLYFIQNSQDYLVYTFNEDGSFNSQPAKKGEGPGELRFPQNFALDKTHKKLWMSNNNSFYIYTYGGKYVENKPYSLAFSDFCVEKNGNIYYYTNKNNNSHIEDGFLTGNITLTTTNGKKKTWFKSNAALKRKPNEPIMSFCTYTPFTEQEDGSITCHYNFCDTIYTIQETHLRPSFVIDLGKDKAKIDLDQISGMDVDKYIQANPQTVWNVRDVIETPDIVTFRYSVGTQYHANAYYNKKNGHILEGRFVNDLLGGNIKILGKKEKCLIGYLPVTDMQVNEKLSSFISPQKVSELKKISQENNPVLINFTLKDF